MAVFLASAAPFISTSALAEDRAAERSAMVETIKQHAGAAAQSINSAVLSTMDTVPRHLFVPEKQSKAAYADRPLPIGHGQTISQPFIVALYDRLDRRPAW